MIQTSLTVANKLGLHARPSAQLAKAASLYQCSLTLTHGRRTVDAKSILGLMTMAVPCGTALTLTADGPDEAEASRHIESLFANKFGEKE